MNQLITTSERAQMSDAKTLRDIDSDAPLLPEAPCRPSSNSRLSGSGYAPTETPRWQFWLESSDPRSPQDSCSDEKQCEPESLHSGGISSFQQLAIGGSNGQRSTVQALLKTMPWLESRRLQKSSWIALTILEQAEKGNRDPRALRAAIAKRALEVKRKRAVSVTGAIVAGVALGITVVEMLAGSVVGVGLGLAVVVGVEAVRRV